MTSGRSPDWVGYTCERQLAKKRDTKRRYLYNGRSEDDEFGVSQRDNLCPNTKHLHSYPITSSAVVDSERLRHWCLNDDPT
jgi:hypothetical protein